MIEMPLRFPGHYFDRETGLHYNGFRYFSPELGRYLEPDPAGLAGGINAYAYRPRPLITVDINGLGEKSSQRPKCKCCPASEVGCKRKEKAALSGKHEGNPDPNKYPKRTQPANEAGRQVHKALAATGGDHQVVAVYTHEDGSRSVGVSGISPARAKQVEDHLNANNGSPPTTSGQQKWKVQGDVDDNLSKHLVDNVGRTEGPTNCAEPRAASAAHSNEEPITGYSVTPSKTYPGDPYDPPRGTKQAGEMGNCPDCRGPNPKTPPGNEKVISNYANTTGPDFNPDEGL